MSTYTQAYFHIVFGVYQRIPCILELNRDRIEKYMTGIVKNQHHKPLQIFCMPDHCHLAISQNLNYSIPTLIRELKADTTNFINQNNLVKGKFKWQEGYAAIGFSKDRLPNVCNYIKNQKQHHQKISFGDEYNNFIAEIKNAGQV